MQNNTNCRIINIVWIERGILFAIFAYILKNYDNPVLILKNSFFDEEIRKQVLEINESIKILTF